MRILSSILLCHFFILALSQNKTPVCLWDKSEMTTISIDSISSELQFGNSESSYTYDGKCFKSRDKKMLIPENFFTIDANVINIGLEKLVLPSSINDAAIEKDSVLFIATESGLYYSPIPFDIVAKKVHLDEIIDLGAIDNVRIEDDYLFMTTADQFVIWNRNLNSFLYFDNDFGKLNEVLIDNYGLLWLATTKGVLRYPLNNNINDVLPYLKVGLWNEGNARSELQDMSLGEKHVFYVEGIHFKKPENVEVYAHPDDGDRNEPIRLENGIYVLEGKKPGNYSLRFSAKLKGSIKSRFSDTYYITVREDGVNYWWYIFGGIGILALFTLIGNLRNQQFQKGILSQRDILLAENKALKSEQQSLRLQMNPHFIFNVLNSINGMIAIGDTKNARKNINQFSQLMRSVLNHSRTEYISLESEIKYLNEYLSLEKVTRNDSFEYDIIVDEHLDLELETLPMIIQPFVENAIVHAFQGIDRNAQIKVELKEQSGHLEVTVQDNGRGRKAANPHKNTEHQSVGLQVVSDRLINPYGYEIQDLESSDGTAQGTSVLIKMPLK